MSECEGFTRVECEFNVHGKKFRSCMVWMEAIMFEKFSAVIERSEIIDVWDASAGAVPFQPDVELPQSAELDVTEAGGGQRARDDALFICVKDAVSDVDKILLEFLRLLHPEIVCASMHHNR